MNALRRCLLFLSRFSPRARAAMLLALDLMLCAFSALLAYSLRIGEWQIFTPVVAKLVFITLGSWLAVAAVSGVYRSLLRFFGAQAIRQLALSCSLLVIPMILLLVIVRIDERIPRTLSVLVPLILFIAMSATRSIVSTLLRETLYSRRRAGRRHVLVYGAGVAGRQLTLSIKDDPEFQIVGFVDDNPVLRHRRLEGFKIWHAADLRQVLRTQRIDEVLLAIPGASRSRRRLIVDQINEIASGVGVRSLPDMSQIATGRVSVSDLREVQIEELLGRDQVAPDPYLMSANVVGRTVMITGAGGSIGSELCRQIVDQAPSRIILAERSELALYLIEGELRELCDRRKLEVEIKPTLVDAADRGDMERVYREHRPATVFHAAAYKHVPLVEADPIAGIRNNILGTYNCSILAEQYGVKNFTLVSTDKAVRPSSVMGASKRVCELVIVARAAAQQGTTYNAVRFGNVLGSSGSVVPLFRRQIANGGPVTVTHRDATRYFMTMPEAAQLVVQAGAMAQGGEIFLLDMGEPVRIYDLAKLMIQLSGLAPADESRRDGDIEIVEIGLRAGEKLHEELLIDNEAVPTRHPRIVKSNEAGPGPSRFDELFATLLDAIDRRDVRSALYSLFELTSGKGAPKGALQPIEKRILRNPPDGWPTVSGKPVFGA